MSLGSSAIAGWRRAKDRAEAAFGGPARLQVILILAAVLALDTADKATVSAVAVSLKDAFQIGNTDIGILIAATSLVGAVFTLPAGVLVDRTRRTRILMVAIGVWSVAMAISGFASSFLFLLITRVALGAVTAAAAPAVASLTGDFFPASERARIYGMILAGELVGSGVGFFVSGEVSSLLGWRWPFYLMSVPGAVLIWTIWCFLPEPARGGENWLLPGQKEIPPADQACQPLQPHDVTNGGAGSDVSASAQKELVDAGVRPREGLVLDHDPTNRSMLWVVRYILRIPTYRLLIIASALGYYFFAGVRAFAAIYFTAHYGVSRATLSALVLLVGIGAVAGVIGGGQLSERLLARKWIRARIAVPGVALLVSVVFFAPAIVLTDLWFGIALLTLGTAALAAANPSIDAARLDIMHPRLWGRAEAGRTVLRSALEGSAPILFGLLSGWLGGGERGLMWAYLLMLIPLLAASALAIPALRTYPRDVATAVASRRKLSN